MGLFRRRKVEEIQLKEIFNQEEENEISEVKVAFVDRKLELFKSRSQEEQKKQLILDFSRLQRFNYDLLNDYFICKIYSRVALKDKDFNKQMLSIDKQINKVRRDHDELQKKINYIKYSEKTSAEDCLSVYDLLQTMNLFQQGIKVNVEDAKRKYFNYLKITTVSIGLNKTNQELETLYQNLNNFLNDYKSIKEAAEYIYYNSGNLIVKTVNSLVVVVQSLGIEEFKKTYDFSYFLKSDVILTLEFTEWIDLYNKIKFVTKVLNDADVSNRMDFALEFAQFEMRHLVLMMYVETNKENKKLTSLNM